MREYLLGIFFVQVGGVTAFVDSLAWGVAEIVVGLLVLFKNIGEHWVKPLGTSCECDRPCERSRH